MAAILSNSDTRSPCLDDEVVAITLQLEEIGVFVQQGKGKHRADQPLDIELACQYAEADLQSHRLCLEDHKLARSIGIAVHEDSAAIAAATSEEIQSHEDRMVALQLCKGSPEFEDAQPSASTCSQNLVDEWMSTVAETVTADSLAEPSSGDGTVAGPSVSFADRQADLLGKLAATSVCIACRERVPSAKVLKLQCEHRYCIECAKGLFIRATRDQELFPPRCCKTPISPATVTKHMTTEDSLAFEAASVEFTTTDRVYCSSLRCGKFIPPAHTDNATRAATCGFCGNRTCCLCKSQYHEAKDCPNDPAIRETRRLAAQMGWQACPSCKTLVSLRSGCNHITCRCKAEFCYVCGERWKTCGCSTADEARMLERAEEVVDRDAEPDLLPAVRNRRVRRIHAELRENHECQHPGRFERVFGGGRRGFQCEMCGTRHWKYILRCRHCYIDCCEDCRRNRV